MLIWSQKNSKHDINIILIAKCGNAIILTADVFFSSGKWPSIDGPKDTIYIVRIRSLWNSKEVLSADYKSNPRTYFAQTPAIDGSKHIKSIDDVKAYCEKRWLDWLEKAGLMKGENNT